MVTTGRTTAEQDCAVGQREEIEEAAAVYVETKIHGLAERYTSKPELTLQRDEQSKTARPRKLLIGDLKQLEKTNSHFDFSYWPTKGYCCNF
jgi:hypothetical protein